MKPKLVNTELKALQHDVIKLITKANGRLVIYNTLNLWL